MQRDSIDFSSSDVGKLFRRFLFPTVMGMVFSAVFVITDGSFVGRGIGSDALASVNIVAPLFTLGTGLGLMFAAIGNYFPKCRPNRTVGIRISWTLGSEENWNATHRFAGKVWVIGGFAMVLAALLPEVPGIIVTILAVAALSILPIAYSYRYHRIHGTKSEPDPLSKEISVGMLIFTAVIVVFVAVMLFTGNLHYRFDSDSFTVKASYFDDLTVKYDAIDGIEYREGNVDGTRTYGVGSFRLLLGTFENEEFGTYTRYTYYRPEACVILSSNGKTLVLSGSSAESTRSLYDTLAAKTGL